MKLLQKLQQLNLVQIRNLFRLHLNGYERQQRLELSEGQNNHSSICFEESFGLGQKHKPGQYVHESDATDCTL